MHVLRASTKPATTGKLHNQRKLRHRATRGELGGNEGVSDRRMSRLLTNDASRLRSVSFGYGTRRYPALAVSQVPSHLKARGAISRNANEPVRDRDRLGFPND